MNFNKSLVLIFIFLLLFGILIAVNQQRFTGMSPTPPGVFASLRFHLSALDPLSLFTQLYILFFVELFLLYGVFQSRGSEVFVFSHTRLWIAVFLMAAINLVYYRVVIFLHPQNLWWLILYYPLIFVGMLFIVMIQQQVLVMVNGSVLNREPGAHPIVEDYVRPELAGNDSNYSIIRRFAPYVFLWYLLIPSLLFNSPLPDLVKYIGGGLWLIMIITQFLREIFNFIET